MGSSSPMGVSHIWAAFQAGPCAPHTACPPEEGFLESWHGLCLAEREQIPLQFFHDPPEMSCPKLLFIHLFCF